SACRLSSTSRVLQFSHQIPLSSDPQEPGEPEPGDDPATEPGEQPPEPGEPPRDDPGEPPPLLLEPGDAVPEPGTEPAPSGAGRFTVRDSSHGWKLLLYHISGVKVASFVCE
ncbi:hypothetical protein chiPu_0032794, partial [Chiloscyllium punctatum]|nr:hypothetical protein [Chiloscyllium punctatum]